MERYTSVFTAKNEDFEVVASMTPYDPDAIPARGDLTSSTPRFYRLLQSFYRLLWSVDLMQVLTMLLVLILIVGAVAIFACVKASFVKSVTSNEDLSSATMPAGANSDLPQKTLSSSENADSAPPECR